MALEDLTILTVTGESETLEFKETTGTHWEAAMTVCAFLSCTRRWPAEIRMVA